jgi:hypothetical protein
MAYSVIPVDVLPSFTLSATVTFLIMIWLGFSFNEAEALETEQIIFLKVKNKNYIGISKILLMLFLGILFSITGTLYPLIVNVINHFHVFTREVQALDIIFSLFVHILYGCLGSMIGLIFHGRIIKNRKEALLLVVFIAVISIVKGSIEQDIPITCIISWIIPPIYGLSIAATKTEYVAVRNLIYPLGLAMVYLVAEIFIYLKLFKHKLF